VPLPRSGGETQAGVAGSSGRHLEIDTQRLARALRRDGTNGDPAESGAPFAEPLSWSGGAASLPAGGDGTRLGGGDGTASTAFGGSAFFASGGYDITPWAQRMVYRVKKNWILPMAPTFSMRAEVGIYLVIGRDGSVSRILIRKASGIRPYDQAALNAIRLSAPLPALPDDFPRADLPAYFLFHYQ
jgi:TonB family protein